MKRHAQNTNLEIHQGPIWNGLEVQSHVGFLITNYLQRILETMNYSVMEYPRTAAFRFDLRFPCYWPDVDSAVITRFFRALISRLNASEARRLRAGKRVHKTRLRYVWVKESGEAGHRHYHVVIFLNKDSYFGWGQFKEFGDDAWMDVPQDTHAERSDCLGDMLIGAWASALNCPLPLASGLVNFSENGVYHIDLNSPDYFAQFSALFRRLSYLAKVDTKTYGDSTNSFGCSYG